MTTPKRTLEEIAHAWWHEWGEHYPEDYDDALDVEWARKYNADAEAALLAALREAADVARREEREAFLDAVQKASGDFYLHDQAMIAQILVWLDARSRDEEK